ncbi:MAG: hypothetical protein ACLGHN_02885 [Bacteriovoracia bacterium]
MLKTVQTFYAQKDYENALLTLKENQGEIPDGLWHYNMGTIYGKMEQYPLARYHFLMADQKGYSGEELFANKAVVEDKLQVGKLEQSYSSTDFLFKAGLAARDGIFTLLGLIFVLSGLISLWKKAGPKVWGTLFVIAFFVISMNWWVDSLDKKVVIESQAIQEGPSAIFRATEELPAGVLIITSEKNGWLKIIYPSRFEGWVKDTGLRELK